MIYKHEKIKYLPNKQKLFKIPDYSTLIILRPSHFLNTFGNRNQNMPPIHFICGSNIRNKGILIISALFYIN